ncbi:hypothetical protein KFU94_23560 [Chloroflexi bacterium TSY]|nr:hypothetical protein [Chloroflexi bacterium TSY]
MRRQEVAKVERRDAFEVRRFWFAGLRSAGANVRKSNLFEVSNEKNETPAEG